jgi:hypothetical protein
MARRIPEYIPRQADHKPMREPAKEQIMLSTSRAQQSIDGAAPMLRFPKRTRRVCLLLPPVVRPMKPVGFLKSLGSGLATGAAGGDALSSSPRTSRSLHSISLWLSRRKGVGDKGPLSQ